MKKRKIKQSLFTGFRARIVHSQKSAREKKGFLFNFFFNYLFSTLGAAQQHFFFSSLANAIATLCKIKLKMAYYVLFSQLARRKKNFFFLLISLADAAAAAGLAARVSLLLLLCVLYICAESLLACACCLFFLSNNVVDFFSSSYTLFFHSCPAAIMCTANFLMLESRG